MNTNVRTRQGVVRGSMVEGVATFKGIPYAAPPFGSNRFQPPRPAEPWDGVREALSYGPTVPKPPYFPPFDVLLAEPVIEGEDCLNLNIWTPDLGRVGLPVMVWIHGGAFTNGSSAVPDYDGSRFARDGVVCVTINYRLGVDGFLYLGDESANLGLLDQVAALVWVQENIAAFGGDPQNVTIFGESAGGMSVATLLSMPRAAGLFHRAIAESGAGHHVLSPSTARGIGQYLAEKLGVEPTREAMAAVPIDRMVQAQVKLSGDLFSHPDPGRWGEAAANLMPFEPVIDGDVLPARPIDRIVAGAGAGDLQEAIVTDWFFRIPAIRLAEAHTQGTGRTYMYEFAWRSPQFAGQLGACHALEIPFVFDTLDKEGHEPLWGATAPQQLADAMHPAWVAFATKGDPGWPQYDLKRRMTMRFDMTPEMVEDPRSAERDLWEGLR